VSKALQSIILNFDRVAFIPMNYLLKPALYLVIWCLVFTIPEIMAQTILRPIENEPPELKWLISSAYEKDTTATAVILFDIGKNTTDLYSGVKFTHHRRIKIYKQSALEEWANVSIATAESRMTGFKCTIYNYENGKIKSTEIQKDAIYKQKLARGLKGNSVAIPNAVAGSIIDYSYTITTPYYTIFSWNFQYSIPVLWSEYEIFFPGSRGGVIAKINGLFNMNDISVNEKGARRKYILTDIPAFLPEPLMPSESYYRSSIQFQPGYSGKFEEEYTKDRLQKYGIVRDSLQLDAKVVANASLVLDSTNQLKGSLIIQQTGYNAKLSWKKIAEIGEDDFLKSELDKSNWHVTKQKVNDLVDSIRIKLEYEALIPNQVQVANNLLLINPFLGLKDETNPFKNKERLYPVDFYSRLERTVTTSLNIPDGYTIESIPESKIIELPKRSAIFSNNISVINGQIFITSRLKLNKIIFNVDEYDQLREFLDRTVSMKSQLIILKQK